MNESLCSSTQIVVVMLRGLRARLEMTAKAKPRSNEGWGPNSHHCKSANWRTASANTDTWVPPRGVGLLKSWTSPKLRLVITQKKLLNLLHGCVNPRNIKHQRASVNGYFTLQVKTWFQNRRMKLKREVQDLRPEFLSVPAALLPPMLFQHPALSGQLPGRCAFYPQLPPLHTSTPPAPLLHHCSQPLILRPHLCWTRSNTFLSRI